MKHRILVVDDELENLGATCALIERWGYDVDLAGSGNEAINMLRSATTEYSVMLLDFRMPNKDGAQTATEIRAFNEEVLILIHSAYPTRENILSGVRAGGVDFIEKGENIEYLKKTLENACLRFECIRTLKPQLDTTAGGELLRSYGLVGRSQKLIDIALQIKKFRSGSRPMLLLGETGVGKEVVARALYEGPEDKFFAINCANLKPGLMGAELFGYERGSFTGANTARAGIFETVRGGTIFLDEIHALDLPSQHELLRAVREQKIRRMNGGREFSVDFRLIAASKPELLEAVERKEFLPDLYFRLRYGQIVIPPLRERPEDIKPLVLHFCQKFAKEVGGLKSFRVQTIQMLESHSWPGNVGELDSVVYNLLRQSDSKMIEPELAEPFVTPSKRANIPNTLPELDAYYDEERKNRILEALTTDGSVAGAARRLGVSRTTLHTLLTRLGIRDRVRA